MYEYLIAVDGDEARATAQAQTVADQPKNAEDIRATILHVFSGGGEAESVQQIAAVRLARDILEDAGIEVTLDETSGDPTTAILETAEHVDAKRICVAGRKRTPTGKVLFGSVSQGVILSTTRPVLVCSADETHD
jgi:nucleotide-binding universal stress UspA family protein